MILATALMLLATQATGFRCEQAARPLWDDLPLSVRCRLARDGREYIVRAGPNRKDGVLTSVSLIVHGVVKRATAPVGWSVNKQPGPRRGSIEVIWVRHSATRPVDPETTSITFIAVVSGKNAAMYCPSGFSYRHKTEGVSGGTSGCPIG